MFTSFSFARNADGIESARLWSILPVSNNIAKLPGLAPAPESLRMRQVVQWNTMFDNKKNVTDRFR